MVVLVLVMIAVPLQLMGYTGTCTQGSDDAALASAIYSAPLLLVAVLLMARHMRRRGRRPVPYLLAGIVAAGLIASTNVIWLGILRFGNACVGQFESGYHELYSNGIGIRNSWMICVYLLFPSLVIVLARFDKVLIAWSRPSGEV
jgi:hypothetical protein